MPKKIEKTVYTFKELIAASEDLDSEVTSRDVERARDWIRQDATEHDWYDCVIESWTDALDQVGFENAKIAFSGFCSQGDGASFSATVDLDKLVNFLATDIKPTDSVGADDKGRDLWLSYIVHKIGSKATNPRYSRLLMIREYVDCSVKRVSHQYSYENTCEFVGEFRDNGECGSGPDYKWSSYQPRLRKLADGFFADAESLRQDLCGVIYKALEEEFDWLNADEQLIESSEANEWTFDENGRWEG